MSDRRTTEQSIAAVLAAAEQLELPVAVEYDRAESTSGKRMIAARLTDDSGVPLATLHDMRLDEEEDLESATDPQAEAMAVILNDGPLLAADVAALRADAERWRAAHALLAKIADKHARFTARGMRYEATPGVTAFITEEHALVDELLKLAGGDR